MLFLASLLVLPPRLQSLAALQLLSLAQLGLSLVKPHMMERRKVTTHRRIMSNTEIFPPTLEAHLLNPRVQPVV